MISIELNSSKKIYFSSDNHLGSPSKVSSIEREKKFILWLDEIKSEAQAIFFLGDLFDFWFEYKRVIPKGFVRLFGKLAELSDYGIELFFFVGNQKKQFYIFLLKNSLNSMLNLLRKIIEMILYIFIN